jgi:drug/metabolite transporter (DMT)-like permease
VSEPTNAGLKQELLGVLLLNAATLLWGTSYVVIKLTLGDVPPSVLTFIRFATASIFFLPFVRWNTGVLLAGLELGVWLTGGYATQTIGLEFTTANRSAFITSMYVVFVPLLLTIVGQKLRSQTFVAAAIAVVGVGLLSYDGSPPNLGDAWTLLCAFFYATYIVRLSGYASQYSPLALSGVQLGMTALFSLGWVMVAQPQWLSTIPFSDGFVTQFPWIPVLYLGAIVTAMTIWFQTWGQSMVNPPEAAIIFTLEPVWGSVFAYLIIQERLGLQGFIGAGAIIAAMLLSQLPIGKREES